MTHENGDALGIIPELKKLPGPDGGEEVAIRFINFSTLARKLAEKRYTLNIFLLSMCRNRADAKISKIIQKVNEEYYGKKTASTDNQNTSQI